MSTSLLSSPTNSSKSASQTPASDITFQLDSANTQHLAQLCGQLDAHLKQIEKRLSLRIVHRGNQFSIQGDKQAAQAGSTIIHSLYNDIQQGQDMSPDHVHLAIQQFRPENRSAQESKVNSDTLTVVQTKKGKIKPRGINQQAYVRAVLTNDINFGIGPAGTGKTYLAVACAVQAILEDEVERILLVRPAVEAGEKLGFLPGDLSQKVDPYLRPLYDALYEMLGFETVDKLIERNVIEVAPLAYMRGRTLNNAFVILDESQNTTREQMKMFLTRIGFGTTAVINGDPSQIDLPRGQPSGLKHAVEVLDGVDGISFTHFTSKDVVRHPIVQRIVEAYERAEDGASRNEG